MAKNTGKVREFCQSGKVGTLVIDLYTIKQVWHSVVVDDERSTLTLKMCSRPEVQKQHHA